MDNKRNFKTALITGISGSGGSYLAEHIVNNYKHIDVHGISRWHSTSNQSNLKFIESKIVVHECDLMDFSSVARVLKKVNPDVIFHLASHANVKAGFINPLSVLDNNITGTANLFEAIRLAELDPVIQLCSTSEVYGQVDEKNVPINEDCPFKPSSPYAVSKTTQDHLGYTYWRCYNLKIIRTRMFAYFNPRRTDLFATSFTKQVVMIEKGIQKKLYHGNLDSVRTMIDIRDAMSAYWVAAEKCNFGEAYNIGGEKTIKVGEFLEVLKDLAHCKIPSEVSKNLLRPADVTLQIPNTGKFKKQTGWSTKYDFEESVKHILEFWRKKIN